MFAPLLAAFRFREWEPAFHTSMSLSACLHVWRITLACVCVGGGFGFRAAMNGSGASHSRSRAGWHILRNMHLPCHLHPTTFARSFGRPSRWHIVCNMHWPCQLPFPTSTHI